MPLLIERSVDAGFESQVTGFRVRSLPVDSALSALLLEMVTREFPEAFLSA